MISQLDDSSKFMRRSPQPESTVAARRYRVVILHPSAGVNWSGGSEIIAIEMARRLSQYFEVELWSGAECGEFSRKLGGIPRTHAFHIAQHPFWGSLLKRISTHPDIVIEHVTNFFPALLKLLRQPPDLVFPLNDYGGLTVAACARFLRGVPVIFTEHNSLLSDGKCLMRNLKFRPDHLVTYDQATADVVRQLKPQQPCSVIPNGTNLEQFTVEGESINLNLPAPIVLCVTSLYKSTHKRVELAIRVMEKLPQASLLICGDGPDRDYFQALGDQLLGSDRFAIHTFPYEQMPAVYRSAHAFTLPSFQEPFGLVYVEAMACGLPVVGTDDPTRRHLVGDGGILCDVTNLDQYAHALRQVLQGNWSQVARQNATRFSWDLVMQQYRNVMIQVIEQSRQHGSKRFRLRA